MKRTLLLFSLLVLGCAAFAQTPLQMIVKMNEAYGKASGYSMSVEMKFFVGNNDVTPLNTFKGEVCREGNNYYSSIMGKTTVVNKNYTVYVDDGQKLILYSSNKNVKRQNLPAEIPDTAAFGSVVKYSFGKGTETSARIEVVPTDQSVYKKIELLINRKNFTLEEVVYHYTVEEEPESSVQQLTVRYSGITLNQPVPAEKFSEARFLVHRKGTFVGTGKYAAYQVIEQENTLPPNLR